MELNPDFGQRQNPIVIGYFFIEGDLTIKSKIIGIQYSTRMIKPLLRIFEATVRNHVTYW